MSDGMSDGAALGRLERDALICRLHAHVVRPRGTDYFTWIDSRRYALHRRDRRRWQRVLRAGR